MNRQQFFEAIKNPASVSISEYEKLLSEYPYFQPGHALYLKALGLQENVFFSKQLKRTAAQTFDRTVLYQFINEKVEAESEKEIEPSIITEAAVEEKQDEAPIVAINENEATEVISAPPAESDPLPEPITQQAEPNTEEPKKENYGSQIISKIEHLTQKEKQLPDPKLIEFEKQLLSEALNIASTNEELPISTPVEPAEKVLPEKPVTENKAAESKADINTNGEYSFLEWLKISKQQPIEKPATVPEKPKEEKKQDETVQKKLIEKFITTEPRISAPVKNEFFSPVNKAKQSVQEDDEFVTETLAKIYAKQGNYSKAIKSYQTLSLKFPEKKLYFAAQIQELKEIIKKNKSS